MSTEYAGSNVYPVTITVPTDGDVDAAVAYAVAMEQLADRTAYLNNIISNPLDLTDATFHGLTTFADGSIVSVTLDAISLTANGPVELASVANTVSITGAVLTALAAGNININAGAALTLAASGNVNVNATGAVAVTGTVADFLGGTLIVDPAEIALGTNVTLGGGIGDTVQSYGVFIPARVRHVPVVAVDADHAYAIADGMEFLVPTLTTTRTYTIAETGAVDGDTMLFTMCPDSTAATGGLIIMRAVDSTQLGPSILKVGAAPDWMMIKRIAGRWQPWTWGGF